MRAGIAGTTPALSLRNNQQMECNSKGEYMQRVLGLLVALVLTTLGTGCSYAEEQGTVQVETSYGQIVAIHEPGQTFSCLGWGCEEYSVDLRDHTDGVDCAGVTSDNIPFYMKVNVVHKPIKEQLKDHLSQFGLDKDTRAEKRWSVLKQHVQNACRNSTSGRFDAYGLRAKQGEILNSMYGELLPKLKDEMKLHLSSVGMDIQPQFADARIDEAANAVVAAQKEKEAEDARKAAADVRAQRQQIEAQIYANPNAMKIEELKLLLEIEKVRAQGIASHQGTLIIGSSTPQIQIPSGGK